MSAPHHPIDNIELWWLSGG